MSIYIVIALLALGSCTGFLAGLLGIGGGMIITPFLTMLLVSTGVSFTYRSQLRLRLFYFPLCLPFEPTISVVLLCGRWQPILRLAFCLGL